MSDYPKSRLIDAPIEHEKSNTNWHLTHLTFKWIAHRLRDEMNNDVEDFDEHGILYWPFQEGGSEFLMRNAARREKEGTVGQFQEEEKEWS